MRRLWRELNTQLRYQIILPFLLLTLFVALAGALVILYPLGQSLQQRFDNNLTDVTRKASGALVEQESSNLQFLRRAAFTRASDDLDTPGVADAMADGDTEGLAKALDLLFREGAIDPNVRLDRLIAFDTSRQTVVDFERPADAPPSGYITHPSLDLTKAWFTEEILSANADDYGDKYAGLIEFADTNTLYFATIAPVYQGENVVGGLIAAMRVESLLEEIGADAGADGITLYSPGGDVIGSTFGEGSLGPMSKDLQSVYAAADKPDGSVLFSNERVGDAEYQFAYVPLEIRGATVGVLAAALSRTDVLDLWNSTVWLVLGLVLALATAIFGLGFYIAHRITKPLEELAATSLEVARGQLDRRATVSSDNEIGQLAFSFNQMTEYLVRLYAQVQSQAGQRAAIVESITDGIVVVDDQGFVKLINRATRRLMGIGDDDPAPDRLADIPLHRLVDGVPGFGTQRAQDLYTLGEYIVRASIAPVVGADGLRSGYVCLLQDMTAEVAVDRARTNFIGTISHELKTPLTVISLNADLLIRGLAGPLEEAQASAVDTIRLHIGNMTALIQNVIIVANLDSGVVETDMVPVDLSRPVEEANWRVQSQIKAKGLALTIEIPADLRPVLADFDHVRQVIYQLLDNAQRYTDEGSITVRAIDGGDHVRVEVQDTGRGVPPDMQQQIFQRFVRGDGVSEGINSAERGIGLGLAICKQLVELQGGTIDVSSVPGQGSTFSFTLRYANDTSSPENQTPLDAAA